MVSLSVEAFVSEEVMVLTLNVLERCIDSLNLNSLDNSVLRRGFEEVSRYSMLTPLNVVALIMALPQFQSGQSNQRQTEQVHRTCAQCHEGCSWSDFSSHWATTSGGSTFHTSVPSPVDDVFFEPSTVWQFPT